MDTEMIIALCYAGISTLGTILSVVKQVKTSKDNKKVREINKYAQIIQKLPDMISQAEEKVGSGNGELKKTLVMQQVELECAEKGIKFKYPGFSDEIETILETPQKKLEKEVINGKENEVETQS